MNMNAGGPRQRTRRAILEAVADVIMETNGIGFSVQAVADRAGLTHRTIYNHFPTREALCDGFYEYVDELLLSIGPAPDAARSLAALPVVVENLYRGLEKCDRHARAAVMLMIGNRRPLKAWRNRTDTLEKLVARAAAGRSLRTPRQVSAAIRLFVSSMGWHLLTEQCGLSTDEAASASAWATQTLLEAATAGRAPRRSSRQAQRGVRPTRRRRR
jgi:AcrR family transcriptional regulator